MTQAHIFYSGTVQGIGFRYAVQRFGSELGLTGWVRNLSDGRVEILVEGKKELIEQLNKSIDEHFNGYIKSKEVNFSAAQGSYKKFEIVV